MRWREISGMALVIASATAYGATAIFAKLAYSAGLGTQQTLVFRFLFAASAMLILTIAAGQRPLRFGTRRLLTTGAIGLFVLTAQVMTFFLALRSLPASFVALVSFTYPAIVVLYQWIALRKSVPPIHVIALCVSMTGVALLFGGVEFQVGWGLAFAIANPILCAAYLLIGERVMDRGQALETSAVIISGAAVGFGVLAALTGELRPPPTPTGWTLTALLALLPTMLGLSLMLGALPRIGAARAAALSTWEPVVTVALAGLVLGERLSGLQALGGLLLLGAAATLQFGERAPVELVQQ